MAEKRFALLLSFAVLMSSWGCSTVDYGRLISPADRVLLADTPFYPQKEYQCGPASLAMMLGASGVNVHPDEIAPDTYIPRRQGAVQVELVATARKYGRLAYVLDREFSSLLAELKNGHPILVLQNYGLESLPAYHYAVVIGVDPPNIILHSGTEDMLHMDIAMFLLTWKKAGSWGVVILKPGELPAQLNVDRFVKSVNALEQSGHILAAEKTYRAALKQEQRNPLLHFALGNNLVQQKRFHDAEWQYYRTLEIQPDHPGAANNLADLLNRRGCLIPALRIIGRAAVSAENLSPSLRRLIEQTRGEIEKALALLPLEKVHPAAYNHSQPALQRCFNPRYHY